MKKLRNRYLTLVLILIMNSILINFLSYDIYNDANAGVQAIEKIPLRVGKWQGNDIPLEDLIYKILETMSIIHRRYTLNEKNVFLSIVYYPQTKVDFHAPESCLAGKGLQISKTKKDIYIIDMGKKVKIGINELVRQGDGTEELIYYFYKAGDFIGPNYIKLRFTLAVNKFANKEKSGSLIRVSTPITSTGVQSAQEGLIEFIEILYPYLINYL